MKILVTGGDGILASAMTLLCPKDVVLRLCSKRELDITRQADVEACISSWRPDWVVNTAAYNFVSRCEEEKELSRKINAHAPEMMAQVCLKYGLRMVHYSTDYVFSGGQNNPYIETDLTAPINEYGVGKLMGERAVLEANHDFLVLRTSWLFGVHQHNRLDYVEGILKQMESATLLRVISGQVSCPTSARDLAEWTYALVRRNASGLVHAVNSEPTSRVDWTKEIVRLAFQYGQIKKEIAIEEVSADWFGSDIQRPDYSALSNSKLSKLLGRELRSWKEALEERFQMGVAK